jgi:acetoin utilization deacetylase AcuC-like enzyme
MPLILPHAGGSRPDGMLWPMTFSTPVVWSPDTRLHDPRHEIWVGVPTVGTEVHERVDVILGGLGEREPLAALAHDDTILSKVHDRDFLTYLRGAHATWMRGPYDEVVGQDRVVPYFFPTHALAQGMPLHRPVAAHALAGGYCYDTMTLIGPGTWQAARAAVDVALTAVDLVASTRRSAYALTRPPGHHATQSGFGGSCYLNNAAVAAEGLLAAGFGKVGILDLDAHHGNGTQAIFWERPDVLYASLHVDPGAGWFPHVLGYADERGAGAGEGATRNVPLAPGTGDAAWTEAVIELTTWLHGSGCTALVVSLGVDAAADDPESPLQVTRDGFHTAGGILAASLRPTVIVQEGGYHLETLGSLVDAFLSGHEA